MEEELVKLLAALGPTGIVAVSMFYVVRIARQMLPSENLQSQTLGMVQSQIDISRNQVDAIKEQNSISMALKEQIAIHDRSSLDRDDKLGQILERLIAEQKSFRTGIDIVIGSVETIAKNQLTVSSTLEKVFNTMPSGENITILSQKLDTIITMLADLKRLHEAFGERLEIVEKEVPPLKAQINQLAASKTTARREKDAQEIPAVPPDLPSDTIPKA